MVPGTVNKTDENWHPRVLYEGSQQRGSSSFSPFQASLAVRVMKGHVMKFWLMGVPHMQIWPMNPT